MLVFHFPPRSSGASESDDPKRSFNRLLPNHGMTVSRRIETSGHEPGVVGTLLVADDDLRLADSRLSGRIHEVSEQMSRLGLLVASSDPPGQQTIQAAGHQDQLQVAIEPSSPPPSPRRPCERSPSEDPGCIGPTHHGRCNRRALQTGSDRLRQEHADWITPATDEMR